MKYQFECEEIKCCTYCPICDGDYGVCELTKKDMSDNYPIGCPLVKVGEEDAK